MHHFSARRGVTLIELLLVVAVIAVLIGLLLPGVQKAREASARAACANNLKQIGLAAHNYHDAHGYLPYSTTYENEGGPPPYTGRGWTLEVLPFLEQNALFDQLEPTRAVDFGSGPAALDGDTARPSVTTPLALFRCPSDTYPSPITTLQFQWDPKPVAVTNYKGVIGDTQMGGTASIHTGTMPDCHTTVGCNGLFYRNSYREKQRLAGVTDGTSNTLMIGEDLPEQNDHSGLYYANGDYASCHAPLNYMPDPPTPADWWNVMSFRSRHPQGANFCRADGAVRFVRDRIDHPTYRAACTKNGGEVPGLDTAP
jgi:prepilin-type N-terminal cleavage/methylation domain-containing protein/prepilin-type processing-associated H-X9-DG protein